MGRLDVLVRAAGQPQSYLSWQRTGNQGNQWRKAVVDIPNVDEFQVGFIFTIGDELRRNESVNKDSFLWHLTSHGLLFPRKHSMILDKFVIPIHGA